MNLIIFDNHCRLPSCKGDFKLDVFICLCEKCNELFHEHCYQYHCYVEHGVCFNCNNDIDIDENYDEFIKCEHCGANIPNM